MILDTKNLFIAGVTNVTACDAPDIVLAYPSDSIDLPEGATLNPEHFCEGDVILVGPLGPDGLIDDFGSVAYLVEGRDLRITRLAPGRFRWVNKLGEYQPFSNMNYYYRGALAQWDANKEVEL